MLAPLAADYDYVFLDCPPSISLVSESVFEAADALLVPLIPATLSSRTLEQLRSVVAAEAAGGPQVLAFFSMVDRRKRLHREWSSGSPREHPGVLRTRDPGGRRRRAHGPAPRPCWRSSPRAAGPPAPTARCGTRSASGWAPEPQ